MYPRLTKGALQKMIHGHRVHEPIVQVLKFRKLSSVKEYVLVIFDGDQIYYSAVLSQQLNSLITSNMLTKYSICQIRKCTLKCIGKRNRLMILDLDVKVPGSTVGTKVPDLGDDPDDPDLELEIQKKREQLEILKKRKDLEILKKIIELQMSQQNRTETTLIKDLNPSCKNVTVKAKVINRFPIKTWSNAHSCGQMFAMDLEDDSGGIRCSVFDKDCDTFFNMFIPGETYYFSKTVIRPAKVFVNNKYEMVLVNYSQVVLCNEEENLICNFTSLSDVSKKQNNDIINVLAIIKTCSEIYRVHGPRQEMIVKDIELTDESNILLKMTLWDSFASCFSGNSGQILAVKGAKIRIFNEEKVLSTTKFTVLHIDPNIIPEAPDQQA